MSRAPSYAAASTIISVLCLLVYYGKQEYKHAKNLSMYQQGKIFIELF